eukprot:jgi/Bigna1/78734/fgenesh1_pg.56_\
MSLRVAPLLGDTFHSRPHFDTTNQSYQDFRAMHEVIQKHVRNSIQPPNSAQHQKSSQKNDHSTQSPLIQSPHDQHLVVSIENNHRFEHGRNTIGIYAPNMDQPQYDNKQPPSSMFQIQSKGLFGFQMQSRGSPGGEVIRRRKVKDTQNQVPGNDKTKSVNESRLSTAPHSRCQQGPTSIPKPSSPASPKETNRIRNVEVEKNFTPNRQSLKKHLVAPQREDPWTLMKTSALSSSFRRTPGATGSTAVVTNNTTSNNSVGGIFLRAGPLTGLDIRKNIGVPSPGDILTKFKKTRRRTPFSPCNNPVGNSLLNISAVPSGVSSARTSTATINTTSTTARNTTASSSFPTATAALLVEKKPMMPAGGGGGEPRSRYRPKTLSSSASIRAGSASAVERVGRRNRGNSIESSSYSRAGTRRNARSIPRNVTGNGRSRSMSAQRGGTRKINLNTETMRYAQIQEFPLYREFLSQNRAATVSSGGDEGGEHQFARRRYSSVNSGDESSLFTDEIRDMFDLSSEKIDYIFSFDGRSSKGSTPRSRVSTTTTTTTTSSTSSKGSCSSSSCGSATSSITSAKIESVKRIEELRGKDIDLYTTVVKLAETNASKNKFNDFKANLKKKEAADTNAMRNYALSQIEKKNLPRNLYWKVCISVGEYLKRASNVEDARRWYALANKIEPLAVQGWLESARLEEECGDMEACKKILSKGLSICWSSELLMRQFLRAQEYSGGDLTAGRMALGRLKNASIEVAWRSIQEGALMEARKGNVKEARFIFKYLMKHVSWYGPIYVEASRFEEQRDEHQKALKIVEDGLKRVPRHGPLWFAALRLYVRCIPEPRNPQEVLRVTEKTVQAAVKDRIIEKENAQSFVTPPVVAPELHWKLHLAQSQILQAHHMYKHARRACVAAADAITATNADGKQSHLHLRWKVWRAGARLESLSGREDVAKKLLNKAMEHCPDKVKYKVLLEAARHEQFFGRHRAASAFLSRVQLIACREWKVLLESALLQIRQRNFLQAAEQVKKSLLHHPGTGRLWALHIQLERAVRSDEEAFQAIKQAVSQVPKSGEVWCEAARAYLNPLSKNFSLTSAKRCLEFAVRFTPQYGDSFVEKLRLERLISGNSPRSSEALCLPVADLKDEKHSQSITMEERYIKRINECINADPNYGALWLLCKETPYDTVSEVMIRAMGKVDEELKKHSALYQRALMRNMTRGGEGRNQFNIDGTIPEDLVQKWRQDNINSLENMYPSLLSLEKQQRFQTVFGSDVAM